MLNILSKIIIIIIIIIKKNVVIYHGMKCHWTDLVSRKVYKVTIDNALGMYYLLKI
jgi:hypothetical protein